VSLVSYCMWGAPGAQYIVKAVIAESRNVHHLHESVSDSEFVASGSIAQPYEAEVIAAEVLRDRERLAASVIAAGAAVEEAKMAKTELAIHPVRASVEALAPL